MAAGEAEHFLDHVSPGSGVNARTGMFPNNILLLCYPLLMQTYTLGQASPRLLSTGGCLLFPSLFSGRQAGKRGGPFWTRVSIVFSSSACQGGQSAVGCLELIRSLMKLILCLLFALCSLGAFSIGRIQRWGGSLLEP